MLDTPPAESEKRSWFYVLLGTLAIYATIPVARALREVVDAGIGREAFLYAGLVIVVVIAILALRVQRRRNAPPSAYLGLVAVFALIASMVYSLREIPEEAIHVIEYGLLGMLVYRALTHRILDYSIYLAATLVVGIIGLIDEYIQWVMPSRVFDMRDVGINFAAGALSQVAIVVGFRPRLVARSPGPASWGRVCRLGALVLLLLLLGFVNTPPRIAWYASKVPGLLFLLDGHSMIAEYGYRHQSESTGSFLSRFSRAELQRLDRERGSEVAAILDRYIRGEGYGVFLAVHSVLRDPYAHEAGVRLFRREYHLDRGREAGDERGQHYHIAYRENQILKRFYTSALQRSTHAWSEDVEYEVSNRMSSDSDYRSPVSANLITGWHEWQVLTLLGLGMLLLFWLGRQLRAGRNRSAPKAGSGS